MKRVLHKLVPRYDKCLNVKATMWKSRQKYVPKLVYSVPVLLLKNIVVWRIVIYFMDGPRISNLRGSRKS